MLWVPFPVLDMAKVVYEAAVRATIWAPLAASTFIVLLALTADFIDARADGVVTRQDLLSMPLTTALGGDTTRPLRHDKAFTFPAANLAKQDRRAFFFGNRLFNTNWVQAPSSVESFDGLGPVFNRVSCSGCHVRDGRGRPPAAVGDPMTSMLVRLSIPGAAGTLPVPGYGDQLQDRAVHGVPPEGRAVVTYDEIVGTYADGMPYTLRRPTIEITDLAFGPLPGNVLLSPRVAPAMFGLGLLEAVPDATLLALADPDDNDGDGISGRINHVRNVAVQAQTIGRFGWKANQPNLRQQNAGAASGDLGLTTALFPVDACAARQSACTASAALSAAAHAGGPEVSERFLDRLTHYTQSLAVPEQRPGPDAVGGERLFRDAGCAACHMPTLVSGDHPVRSVANQIFHPFTDLLLHDMGPELADGRPDFDASGNEWRTPPLWGIGLLQTVNRHQLLLHDGRARGVAEAILWHGGEAAAARDAFRSMPGDQRAALVAFINSL